MRNSRRELLTRLFNLHNNYISEPGTSPRRTTNELLTTIKTLARSRARSKQTRIHVKKRLSPSPKRQLSTINEDAGEDCLLSAGNIHHPELQTILKKIAKRMSGEQKSSSAGNIHHRQLQIELKNL